jgi:hypothetical protein
VLHLAMLPSVVPTPADLKPARDPEAERRGGDDERERPIETGD